MGQDFPEKVRIYIHFGETRVHKPGIARFGFRTYNSHSIIFAHVLYPKKDHISPSWKQIASNSDVWGCVAQHPGVFSECVQLGDRLSQEPLSFRSQQGPVVWIESENEATKPKDNNQNPKIRMDTGFRYDLLIWCFEFIKSATLRRYDTNSTVRDEDLPRVVKTFGLHSLDNLPMHGLTSWNSENAHPRSGRCTLIAMWQR